MPPEHSVPAGGIAGFDHVSLPMQHTEAMVTFYRALGCDVVEQRSIVSVYVGDQMINLHRPELWPREGFTLRAPEAKPPCGDLCFVWEGTADALHALLREVGAAIEEGPVSRQGGRRADATSVYTRDPDGNLLEFMIYENEAELRRAKPDRAGAGVTRRHGGGAV